MEIMHFNSTTERLQYLKGKFEEIVPQIAENSDLDAENEKKSQKKASKSKKKAIKDDKVQAE